MIDKSEIRKDLFHSAGCDADDWLEGARKNVNAFDGAKQALTKAAKDVQSISAAIKAALEKGEIREGMEPNEVAAYGIAQVTRCVTSLMASSKHYNNLQLTAQGEVSAYAKLVKHFSNLHEGELTKAENLKEALESGGVVVDEDGTMQKQPGNGRVSGVRPAMGVAAQRKAEAAAEAAADGSNGEVGATRSEERRVGKECRSRWSPYH